MIIHIIWRGEGQFYMVNKIEREQKGKRFIIDRVYEAEIKTRRNKRKHDLYWKFLESIAFHFGGSAKTWHEELKRLFMRKKMVWFKNGSFVELPESEAFDRCTEVEFSRYFEEVQRYFAEKGYTLEELIRTAE